MIEESRKSAIIDFLNDDDNIQTFFENDCSDLIESIDNTIHKKLFEGLEYQSHESQGNHEIFKINLKENEDDYFFIMFALEGDSYTGYYASPGTAMLVKPTLVTRIEYVHV